VRDRKNQRETLESRSGALTLGATGKGSVSPDGVVRNMAAGHKTLESKMRRFEPYLASDGDGLVSELSGTTSQIFDFGNMGDFPDIHASFHASSRMPNVLTVKKLSGGRFLPVNKVSRCRSIRLNPS